MWNRIKILAVLFSVLLPALSGFIYAADFESNWPEQIERVWVGPEYWTNPLPDWRVSRGRLECHRSGGDRNVYLLTRELGTRQGNLEMSVTLGRLEKAEGRLTGGWVGFKVGSLGEFNDYRDSAVRGDGINTGLSTDGVLFIGGQAWYSGKIAGPYSHIRLHLRAEPEDGAFRATVETFDRDGKILSQTVRDTVRTDRRGHHVDLTYMITLEAFDKDGKLLARAVRDKIHPDWLTGSVALVCSAVKSKETDLSRARPKKESDPNKSREGEGSRGNVRFWFRDWKVSGSKVEAFEQRAWGPVLFTQYTLSRGVLKLKAQMAPVGNGCRAVELQTRDSGTGRWEKAGEELIDPLARTATFRISNWDDTRNTGYRLVYPLLSATGETVETYFSGTVKRDPTEKEEIVVAAFTGNNDFGFPHADIVRSVSWHRPDLLVFTGDQIYERTGGYGVIRGRDVNLSTLDYLRKWYMFGWEYRDLLKVIPSVSIPDDHDVFQGNIWGAGGRPAELSPDYAAGQDNGGYCMPPVWVDMVQRTQTSHMADPYDPTPVEQGISVYYGPMQVGGVSFAVVEDRKWKSSPKELLPEGRVINGWIQNPGFDSARDGDVAGAVLLGKRQLDFLEHWAADWSGGTWMKAVISQTLFATLATLPPPARGDDVVPRLRVMQPGEYAQGEVKVQDHDSDGWPQTGRNRAVEAMRRGFAFHISGDQHLGSTVQYGVDDWRDGPFAICVPSVANVWPRRWFPPQPGKNRKPGAPEYTGDFLDGFGNKVSVHAVSNPIAVGIEPTWINHRAPGYGIVRFNRNTRRITIANWPRWVDPSAPGAEPYPGWPVTIDQTDNYNRTAAAWLPAVEVSGMADPVVQVIDQTKGEIVYTLRIKGTTFRPRVFKEGLYTIRVGEPGTGRLQIFDNLNSLPESSSGTISVRF